MEIRINSKIHIDIRYFSEDGLNTYYEVFITFEESDFNFLVKENSDGDIVLTNYLKYQSSINNLPLKVLTKIFRAVEKYIKQV